MIKATTKKELEEVLEYISPNKGECIYLYIDLTIYGIDNEFIDLWYEKKDELINFVVMRYHDSLQLYSKSSEWDRNYLLKIINQYNIKAVNGKIDILDNLTEILPDFEKKSGWMFKARKPIKTNLDNDVVVEIATVKDAKEIAELMCSNEQWNRLYDEESLEKQLIERMKTGMGRSFIIRDEGKIVAHDATFAETNDIVMAAGLIVKKEYIDKMYGTIVGNYMDRVFLSEGKEKYFHISDPRRMRLFKKMGNELIAETGKLIKKKDL